MSEFAVADFDGDGVADLLSVDTASNQAELFSGESGTFTGIARLNLLSQENALGALAVIEEAEARVQNGLGQVGASTSRLSIAINNLSQTVENYRAAEGRIVDADIAQETADLVRNQILQQTAAAVAAQVNQQPRLVLALLSDGLPGP